MARSISITLDDLGVAEVASLQITAAATATEDVSITLDGSEILVAVVSADTAIAVADKIRAASFAGWTTGGTGGTDTVTFTSDTIGEKLDIIYSEGTTGATGAITITTQGVDRGEGTHAYKIALDIAIDFEEMIQNGETVDPIVSGSDPALTVSRGGLKPSERFTFDITDLDPVTGVYVLVLV